MKSSSGTSASPAELRAAGKGVWDIRKLGFSPAEIRSAGFTLEEMHVHFGMHRLLEAGYQLSDFQAATGFELSEIFSTFSYEEIYRSGVMYDLRDLIKSYPPAIIREIGGYKAADFLALGSISAVDLRRFGFSEAEIEEGFRQVPPPPPNPTPSQPPHAREMQVGEAWQHSNDKDTLHVTFTRIPAAESRALLYRSDLPYEPTGSYGYDGSGRHCPRCGRLFILLPGFKDHADDMCADHAGTWLCDDPECGMQKSEVYTGYGSAFQGPIYRHIATSDAISELERTRSNINFIQ